MSHSPGESRRLCRQDLETIDLFMNQAGLLDDPAMAPFKMAVVNVVMELEAEQRRSAILAKGLNTYGRHHNGDQGEPVCDSESMGPDTCTCGLDPVFHVAHSVGYDAAVNYFLSYPAAKELPKKD